jgi:hypothetical protein
MRLYTVIGPHRDLMGSIQIDEKFYIALLRANRTEDLWHRGAPGTVFGLLRARKIVNSCSIAESELYDVCGGRRRRKSGHST